MYLQASFFTLITTAVCSAKEILVFGGNGNIGSEVVAQLLETKHNVHLVNRGTPYWDSTSRIFHHVPFSKCDRYKGCEPPATVCNALENCKDLMEVLKTSQFDAVIDFSAQFHPTVMENALRVLHGKVPLYIYINTHRIYEVCEEPSHGGWTRETDAVRIEDPDQKQWLMENEMYGDHKLRNEEILIENRSKGGPAYLILRLPFVLGPRDTTFRFWTYQMWVKYYDKIQTPIPVYSDDSPSSGVYVEDIASVITKAIEQGEKVHDQIYNVASFGDFGLEVLVKKIATILGVAPPEIVRRSIREDDDPPIMFPFNTRGPLDITKVQEDLDFKPTSWESAMNMTVQFYESAFWKFPRERLRVMDLLLKNVIPEKNHAAFLAAIEEDMEKNETMKKTEL